MNPSLELQIQTLPDNPGVYQYYDAADKILYVGKAKNLKKRVASYFNKVHDNAKTNVLVRKIVTIKHIVVATEADALLLENNLIKKLQIAKNSKNYESIMYHSYGAMGVSNKFYIVAEDYGTYLIVVPIDSKYSSNTGVGYEEPNLDFKFDKKIDLFESEIVKKQIMDDGKITMFGKDYIFKYWEGNPLYYDWHD